MLCLYIYLDICQMFYGCIITILYMCKWKCGSFCCHGYALQISRRGIDLPMQTGGRPSPSGTSGVHDRILSPLVAVQLHLHHHAGHIRGSDEVRPSGAVGRGRRLSGSVQ